MIIRLTNTIGAIGRRLGIVTKNLQMWLGFYKSDVIGRELVVNGDFSDGITGWSVAYPNTTLSINDDELRATANSSGAYGMSQELSLNNGSTYQVVATINVDSASGGTANLRVATNSNLSVGAITLYQSTGTITTTFVATSSTMYIGIADTANDSNNYVEIDNISVKEVTQFVKDKSTNSNDAKLFTGKALSFGGNDYVDCGVVDTINSDVVSVAFWSKVDSGASMLNSNILGSMTSGGAWGTLLVRFSNNTTFKVLWNNAYSKSVTIPDVRDGVWHRYVVVRSGSGSNLSLDIYIDGILASTTSSITTVVGTYTSNFSIGRGGDYDGGYLRGEVSDVEVYDAKLELDDVVFDYNNPNHLVTDNPNTTLTLSNLSAYYALSEGSGSKIYDSTGLGAELVVNGDFATSDDWTANALQWVVSGGKANALGVSGLLSNTGTVVIGSTYVVSFDIVNYTSGSVKVYSGAGADTSPYYSSDGTHTFTFEPNSVNILAYSNSFIGSIDNVSVKLVKADDGTSYDGTSIGATWVDQQPTIPQLGLMDWSKGSNLVEYSEDLTATGWSSQRTGVGVAPIVTNNFALSPIGEMNASRIVFDIGSGTLSTDISQLQNRSTIVNGDTYVTSMYIKSANATDYDISVSDVSSFVQQFTVNQVWQRISLSGSYAGTNGDIRIRLRGHEATSKYADILIYAPQLEPDTLGSYIATSGSIASNATLVQNPNDKGKDVLGNSLRLRERGFNLDGSGYAEVADDDSLDFGTGDFSIETWVKADYLSQGSSINSAFSLGEQLNGSDSSGVGVHGATSKFICYIGGSSLTSNNTYVIGIWYNILITRASGLCTMYVDATPQIDTETNTNSITSSSVKYVGRDSTTTRFYNNTIDEPRLYNRALTQKEITNNYKVGLNAHKVGSAFSTEFSSEFGF